MYPTKAMTIDRGMTALTLDRNSSSNNSNNIFERSNSSNSSPGYTYEQRQIYREPDRFTAGSTTSGDSRQYAYNHPGR